MGTLSSPAPVQFFASLIFNDSRILADVERELTEGVAPIFKKTQVAAFTQSNYYNREMGEGLLRYFVLFSPLVNREDLRETKLQTNQVETMFSVKGCRSVNIDPGYISLEHVVLATTKGYSHRIYLGKGIYGDLTLIFENGTYSGLKWTYPDYGSQEFVTLLNEWRELYKGLLRCQRA